MPKLNKLKLNKQNIQKLLYIFVFLLASLTMNSDKLGGYMGSHSTPFAATKVILVAISVAIVTYINRHRTDFVIKASAIITSAVLVLAIADNYTVKISGSLYLYRYWWLISMYIALFTMLLTITLCKNSGRCKCKVNKKFLQQFCYCLSPLYIYTFIICFLRDPSKYKSSMNLVPFKGTFVMLKSFLNNPTGSFEAALLFFGNLFVFMPAAFIVRTLLPKAKTSTILFIGILFPLFAEGYQYALACGDVDIDDVILNYMGFVLGVLIQKFIQKRLLRK